VAHNKDPYSADFLGSHWHRLHWYYLWYKWNIMHFW